MKLRTNIQQSLNNFERKGVSLVWKALAFAGLVSLGFSLTAQTAKQPTGNQKPATTQSASGNSELDAIVAVVNRGVITRRQLNQRVQIVRDNITRAKQEQPPLAVLEREVLERMILEKVQLQEAEEVGVKVEDAALDKAIDNIAQQNKMTPAQWKQNILKSGQSWEEYREAIRTEIQLLNMRDIALHDLVKVSESEIDGQIRSMRISEANIPQLWTVAQILVHIPEGASEQEKSVLKQRADKILQQVRSGANFQELARKVSDGSESSNGGVLGTLIPPKGWPKVFVEQLSSMNQGDVSGLIQTAQGFHILKLVEKKLEGNASRSPDKGGNVIVDQAKARHILIAPSAILTIEQAKTKINSIRDDIMAGKITFEEAAKKHSTDSSGPLGGDLGWISPGQTVPPFEKAMNATNIGQISPPVLSQFGWHIIQVEDRRRFDATSIVERQKAEAEIRQRKASRAYEDWMHQLRDRAFVDIRLDQVKP